MSEKRSQEIVAASARAANSSVVEFKAPMPIRKKPNLKVLEEDTYISGLEEIIQRDFFPDLPKLRAQLEYLTALESNDIERMREISFRYRTPSSSRTPHTPAPFETPIQRQSLTPSSSSSSTAAAATGTGASAGIARKRAATNEFEDDGEGEGAEEQAQPSASQSAPAAADGSSSAPQGEASKLRTDMSLDEYLDTYTSEDNASFQQLLEETHERVRKRHSWFYDKVNTKQLQLENGERKEKGEHYLLDMWRHEHVNALMYVPQEKALSDAELAKIAAKEGVKIQHGNTRFDRDIFAGATSAMRSSASGSRAGTLDGLEAKYRIGGVVFGHEHEREAGESPKVNGYGFVVTPSPASGVDTDPLMTWGEIGGMPFRLDASDIPLHTSGPLFKIQEESYRDKLAREMVEKAQKRGKSANASTAASRSSSTKGTPVDRFTAMSPAAQMLARNIGGKAASGFGSALRASYGGTGKTPSGDGVFSQSGSLAARDTPRNTPRSTPRSTASRSTIATPLGSVTTAAASSKLTSSASAASAESAASAAASVDAPASSSITDDLLS